MFLDKKTLLKIWLNPGLNLTIFRGTWPWGLKLKKTLTLLHFGCVFYTYIIAVVLSIAFNTPTGMPYGTVNLRYGVPPSETSITCTAGCGTFIIEFGTISALTGTSNSWITEGLYVPWLTHFLFGGVLLHGALQHYPVPLVFVVDLIGT